MMFSSAFNRKALFVLASFLMPIEVWAAIPTKPVEVRLDSEITVSGETVVLGDVATIYAKSIHDFQALSNLTISKVGESGVLRLPQGYLENRIREVLPAGTDFRLHSPAQVTFRMDKLGSTSDEFVAEISRRGRAEGKIPEWAEVDVEAMGGFEQLKTWKLSEARIEPAAVTTRWKGEMSFRVSRGEKDLIWLKVKVRWFADAWTAKRSIGVLSALKADDFTKARVEVTNLREDPILAFEDIETVVRRARNRRSLAAGSALVSAALEKAPDAKPGQSLKVVFVSESGVRVSTEGSLLGAASIGNEVRVKLRSSRKVVTGKLVSGDLMEVSL
jgi:flagella basal body P-ring formation protein FlgA